ncbi:hypothetical protein ACHAXA_009750 [Cyclostephanos tholiformis]|uniref:SET domain-containing protein n=1 Tax=Cyclostephanos tholiformis TaxID=382380 RepID=A0ABD3SH16_9STRA
MRRKIGTRKTRRTDDAMAFAALIVVVVFVVVIGGGDTTMVIASSTGSSDEMSHRGTVSTTTDEVCAGVDGMGCSSSSDDDAADVEVDVIRGDGASGVVDHVDIPSHVDDDDGMDPRRLTTKSGGEEGKIMIMAHEGTTTTTGRSGRRMDGGGQDYIKDDENDDDDDENDDDDDGDWLPHGRCGLYLAPSTLSHAGLGLYSGASIPYGSSVNEYVGGTFPGYDDVDHPPLWTDLFVPIADDYKALPYRGQQRYPSWLSYVWPRAIGALSDLTTTAFPVVPIELWDFDVGLNYADGIVFRADEDTDEPKSRVNAFVPGLASLANSDGRLYNMDRSYKSGRVDYDGQRAPWQPGVGAFTPHHGVEFTVSKKGGIYAGMELLLNYGPTWSSKNKQMLAWLGDGEDHDVKREREGFVDGINKKWDHLDKRERRDCPDELPTEKAKRDRLAKGMAADSSLFGDGDRPYSEYRTNDHHPHNETADDDDDNEGEEKSSPWPLDNGPYQIMKSLPWLDRNGICLSSGRLQVKRSSIKYAGRGVFATTHIGRDQVVLTSPLIVMRREDFDIYRTNPDADFLKDQIDKSTVVGVELIYNYAFAHPDSPLYLVPNAPLANFINHGGPFASHKPKSVGANVELRWPKDGSNAAKLFEWAYKQKRANRFDNDFENTTFDDANPWLRDHPIDVLERSGKLALEYVALRDIHNGEEILLDYGRLWQDAWEEYSGRNVYARSAYFRHNIGVPPGFFPDNWLHVSDRYEIAEIRDLANRPLEPGVAIPMTWSHNGKPVASKYAYLVGLEKGFSDRFLEYSEKEGVIELYRKLLSEKEGYHLPSDGFGVYRPAAALNNTSDTEKDMEFFAHRYKSDSWNFNMHFVAAWDESARKAIFKALGDAGFDLAVKGIGERFGYENMTCFHASYMGVTHCDKSKMHSDIYATGDKSWNIIFPLITVDGTDPELDIMAEDMNTVIGVNYLKDVAFAMGDFGYHQTRPINYYNPDDERGKDDINYAANGLPIRVVFGAYCAQIDETNVAMIRHIYDGDDPAPFADQFENLPMKEIHWDRDRKMCTLGTPGGI